MKRTKQNDIASFFSKRINIDNGDPSMPNPHQSETNFCPPINNLSTQETNNIPQNQRDETDVRVNTNPEPQAANEQIRLTKVDATNLPQHPGKRKKIRDFHPDDQDIVQRVYTSQRKLCQPTKHEFPYRFFLGQTSSI